MRWRLVGGALRFLCALDGLLGALCGSISAANRRRLTQSARRKAWRPRRRGVEQASHRFRPGQAALQRSRLRRAGSEGVGGLDHLPLRRETKNSRKRRESIPTATFTLGCTGVTPTDSSRPACSSILSTVPWRLATVSPRVNPQAVSISTRIALVFKNEGSMAAPTASASWMAPPWKPVP